MVLCNKMTKYWTKFVDSVKYIFIATVQMHYLAKLRAGAA